ncbi:ECs1072 family phage-associated protein [Lelliottia amnigena]|uniref:ECs1072 family phage-associated protein n=1 Tax=Lelliottia amnigena TaxID=61646 RepID=UPI00293BDF52|nr:hypothetical protein [Lelliottia amnigena]
MSVISDIYFEIIQNKVSAYHGVPVYGQVKQPDYDQMKNRSVLIFALEVVLHLHRTKYATPFSPLKGKDALTHLLLQKYKWPLSEIRSLSLKEIILALQDDLTFEKLPDAAVDVIKLFGFASRKSNFADIKDDEWEPELYLSIPKQQTW